MLSEAAAFRVLGARRSSELSGLRMAYYTAAMGVAKDEERTRMNTLAFNILKARRKEYMPWQADVVEEQQDWTNLGDAGLTKRYERAFGVKMDSPEMQKKLKYATESVTGAASVAV